MTYFERIVGGEVFVGIWRQMRQFVFKENRWRQLLSLEPIEIYTAETELELDNTKIQLHIRAYLENIVQRRIERAKDLLSLNFLTRQFEAPAYTFHVIIHAQTGYDEISKFFNLHFASRKYEIVENKYSIFLERFKTGADGTKARVELPFYVDARWWFIKRRLHGVAVFKGSLAFNTPPFSIKTRNLNYSLTTNSWLLKIADSWYHSDILHFLSGFLIYNFREEIFHARIHAQEQLNEYQHGNAWINGTVNEMDLDRVTIDPDALRAVFHAKGKLHLVR
jgi:Domain of unknown function (DUF4403)